MKRFALVTGGMAAAILLSAAVAMAQQNYDPMAGLTEAPAYDALHPLGTAPAEDQSPPEAAAPRLDPMAAVARPQEDEATTDLAQGEPDPEFGGLPAGPGAEETYYQCVACHSTAIIKQQHVTSARWDDLWHWMIEEQGMIEPDDETKDIILGYLKKHFSS